MVRPHVSKLMFRCIYQPRLAYRKVNVGCAKLSTANSGGTTPPPITTSQPSKDSPQLIAVRPFQEERWERNFQLVKNELAKKATIEDPFLKDWMMRQRADVQKRNAGDVSTVSDDRLKKLQQLEEQYGLLGFQRSQWEVKFNELVEFLEKNDGVFPYELEEMSPETKILEAWCRRQRKEYQLYQKGYQGIGITIERIDKLKKIGFQWKVNDAKWSQRYQELVDYYNHFGDSIVPLDYSPNPSLGHWVRTQREKVPSPERKRLLDELEFVWDLYEYRWMVNFNELKAYMAVHGKGKLPGSKSRKYRSLSSWIKYQKACYRKFLRGETSSMTEHRKQLLDVLGLDFGKQKKK